MRQEFRTTPESTIPKVLRVRHSFDSHETFYWCSRLHFQKRNSQRFELTVFSLAHKTPQLKSLRKEMSTAEEIEIIIRGFHRSAYRHFERSTACLSQRSLHLCCSALPSVELAVKSKKRSRTAFQKSRTVHKTLGEVANRLDTPLLLRQQCGRRVG